MASSSQHSTPTAREVVAALGCAVRRHAVRAVRSAQRIIRRLLWLIRCARAVLRPVREALRAVQRVRAVGRSARALVQFVGTLASLGALCGLQGGAAVLAATESARAALTAAWALVRVLWPF